jgi:peptidoglycan/xylan/chitin deacetylase (PgdA/CDA1 family)
MLKTLLGLLSPAGAQGRLSVLILHRVLPEPDPLYPEEIDAAAFDRLCGWLAPLFNVLPLDEAVQRLVAGTLPQRALSISFDDGYADSHDVALPILLRHRLCATFFITSGALQGGCMWNDVVEEAVRRTGCAELDLSDAGLERYALGSAALKRRAIERIDHALKYLPPEPRATLAQDIARRAGVQPSSELMLSHAQLRALRRAGMQIGAHTVSHPILTGLSAAQVRQEIGQGKRALESILGETVELFAYPNGKWGRDFDAQAVALVREAGFQAAFTTDWGSANRDTHPLLIPRFMPWDRTRLRFGLRLAANLRHGSGPTAVPTSPGDAYPAPAGAVEVAAPTPRVAVPD